MLCKHWFGYWLGDQAITWANTDLVLGRYMESLGHSQLNFLLRKILWGVSGFASNCLSSWCLLSQINHLPPVWCVCNWPCRLLTAVCVSRALLCLFCCPGMLVFHHSDHRLGPRQVGERIIKCYPHSLLPGIEYSRHVTPWAISGVPHYRLKSIGF